MNLQEKCHCGGTCTWSTLWQVYVCEKCEATRSSSEMSIIKDYLKEKNEHIN